MGLFSRFLIGAEWVLFKRGLSVTNHFESGGFIRSDASLASPDDFSSTSYPPPCAMTAKKSLDGHGFMVLARAEQTRKAAAMSACARPTPFEQPDILFNYLDREEGREGFRRCLHLTREIIAQPAFDRFRGEEMAPGKDVQKDDEIDAWVRGTMESTYHPCGSCRSAGDGGGGQPVEGARPRRAAGHRQLGLPQRAQRELNAPTIMLVDAPPTWCAVDSCRRQTQPSASRPALA